MNSKGELIKGITVLKRNHHSINRIGLLWIPNTQTNESGLFVVDDLIDGGTYSFCALNEQYGTINPNGQYWDRENNTIPPIIVYPRDGHISGFTINPDGTPLPNVNLTMEPCLGIVLETKSDSEGHFSFEGIASNKVVIRGKFVKDGFGYIGQSTCTKGEENTIIKIGYEEIPSRF